MYIDMDGRVQWFKGAIILAQEPNYGQFASALSQTKLNLVNNNMTVQIFPSFK